MSKYQYTENSGEISGMGGGYESACKEMVITGMDWLDNHEGANPTFDEFENMYGVTTNENDDMKAMQKVMNEAIGNEATGAMMQACTNHILHAKEVGWETYITEMEEKTKKDG